jgi:hypothetical protein
MLDERIISSFAEHPFTDEEINSIEDDKYAEIHFIAWIYRMLGWIGPAVHSLNRDTELHLLQQHIDMSWESFQKYRPVLMLCDGCRVTGVFVGQYASFLAWKTEVYPRSYYGLPKPDAVMNNGGFLGRTHEFGFYRPAPSQVEELPAKDTVGRQIQWNTSPLFELRFFTSMEFRSIKAYYGPIVTEGSFGDYRNVLWETSYEGSAYFRHQVSKNPVFRELESRARLANVWPYCEQIFELREIGLPIPIDSGGSYGRRFSFASSSWLEKALMLPVSRFSELEKCDWNVTVSEIRPLYVCPAEAKKQG